ncbi:acyl-CoA thioesterase [Kaistella jeonii]|uniref:Thioesterase n=1 Tax=Kaistella jeonii TaxID=266749 RepID=A0A0C1FF58_9FLAO|nr:hotdog domain-containing protein [Kaistella jeonii]KIA90453.1 thioesterase [Kaistella jeonii]SFB72647.1 Acyl-CoA hydrolase [Kaistella jeonii]VEI94983.1 acyl-CoA esterase [Kaistella jeonii]
MNYHTRKWIKPEDLNPNQTLFGGKLLQWIDEESALYAIVQLETPRCVTKFISEINFISSAKQGDIIEIGIEAIAFGRTSITLACNVRNMMTRQTIITIDKLVFVGVDNDGKPTEHGKTQIEFIKDRLKNQEE